MPITTLSMRTQGTMRMGLLSARNLINLAVWHDAHEAPGTSKTGQESGVNIGAISVTLGSGEYP